MEIACLKIKFIPLIKETFKNNRKCYLEIVPEVSYIHNLDKLTWRHETNYIEYTVPMTHKIILRKQSIVDINEEIVKTYHSCVDLLISSPIINHNNSSCDIYKILSDSVITTKLASDAPLIDNAINCGKDYKEFLPEMKNTAKLKSNNADINSCIAYNSDNAEVIESNKKEIKKEGNNDETKPSTDQKQFKRQECTNSIHHKSTDKSINTENKFVTNNSTKDALWPKNISKSHDFKHKLSLSPICSIDTEEFIKPNIEIRSSKAIAHKKLSFNDMEPLSNHSNDKLSYVISQFEWLSQQNSIKSIRFSSSYRSPPEIKVAQYVHQIRNELLPLNEILDKLLKKCSALGIRKEKSSENKSCSETISSCKSVSVHNNQIEEICEKSVSNRAVYTYCCI